MSTSYSAPSLVSAVSAVTILALSRVNSGRSARSGCAPSEASKPAGCRRRRSGRGRRWPTSHGRQACPAPAPLVQRPRNDPWASAKRFFDPVVQRRDRRLRDVGEGEPGVGRAQMLLELLHADLKRRSLAQRRAASRISCSSSTLSSTAVRSAVISGGRGQGRVESRRQHRIEQHRAARRCAGRPGALPMMVATSLRAGQGST